MTDHVHDGSAIDCPECGTGLGGPALDLTVTIPTGAGVSRAVRRHEDFAFYGELTYTDEFTSAVTELTSIANEAGLFGSHAVGFWPVYGGDGTSDGGLVTVDLSPGLSGPRVASMFQEWRDLVDDRDLRGFDLCADIVVNVGRAASTAVANLQNALTPPPVTGTSREEKQAAFETAIDRYRDARSAMNTAATELIIAIAQEFAPDATKVMLEDSDQEGSDFTFSHFEDANDNVIEPTDADAVSDLIEAPVSSLYPDGIGYYILVPPTEREDQ